MEKKQVLLKQFHDISNYSINYLTEDAISIFSYDVRSQKNKIKINPKAFIEYVEANDMCIAYASKDSLCIALIPCYNILNSSYVLISTDLPTSNFGKNSNVFLKKIAFLYFILNEKEIVLPTTQKYLPNFIEIIEQRKNSFDNLLINHPFQLEHELISFIQTGNIELVQNQLKSYKQRMQLSKLLNGSMEQKKDTLITITLIIMRVVIITGVSEQIAFALGNSFLEELESTQQINNELVLLEEIIKDFTTIVEKSDVITFSAPVQSSIYYIDRHLYSKINVASVANHIHVSISYLSKIFKDDVHISIGLYISKQKVLEAAFLLISTNYTYEEIAQLLHFTDQSHLSRLFKKQFGIPPARYRKQHKIHANIEKRTF